MAQTNQTKKLDDFKLAVILRIEGRNSRAIILRLVGIVCALVAVGAKVVGWLMEKAP